MVQGASCKFEDASRKATAGEMEYVDHVAARVSFSALTGLSLGSIYSILKGYPVRSTSLKIASSFAMVGTVVFGFERVGYVAMKEQIQPERRLLLTSHAFSGVAGGAMNGYLFHKKPRQGMFYFIPAMMGIAAIEILWENKREERIRELMLESDTIVKGQVNDQG